MNIDKVTPVFRTYTKEELKLKRRLLGYSQSDVALLCGVTSETIRNVESGRTEKLSSLYLIGVCLERLYDRCEDESAKKAIDVLGI